jgi:RNA polymerase sigma factor (sigma-70 family)
MANPEDSGRIDDVLAHSAWIRRLAHRLVSDAADRDDVVQDAWVEALQHAPRARQLRPWLSGVLRNVVRMDRRGEGRRRVRETVEAVEAVEGRSAPSATPEQLVERVELEREVAAALLEVAEPYRSTLLWRYFDDLSAAEIARRSGVPAGTVRWRLKQGLDLLRARLDARFDHDRRRWCIALVPTAAAAHGGLSKAAAAIIGGALIMKATTKTVAALAILLLLLLGSVRLWQRLAPAGDVAHARPGAAWRMPGGIGSAANSPLTVGGLALPAWFGQRGAPVRRIAGRVTFAGEPVANATVELGSQLSDADLMPRAKLRTGADGRFDFGTQPPAKFSVAASADDHGPAIVEADTRDPTSATERLELRLSRCDATLFGHVNDSSGGPIASAQVCAAPPRATACVSADVAGAYSICVSPRQQYVSVAAPGYGAIYDRTAFAGRRVQRDYALTPEATLVGRVVRADTNAPVAGASVRVEATADWQRFAAPAATASDAQGKFSIAGLAPGRQRLVAFAAGLATSAGVDVNVEAGRSSGEVLLRLRPGSRLSGVVTDGRDPIVGATVSLGVGSDGRATGPVDAITQADGSFVIDPAPRGRTVINVSEHEVLEPKAVTIDRPIVDGIHLVVANMGSIAGHVTMRGKPLAGARVQCGRSEAVYTDNDGTYTIRGLAPDRYRVFGDESDQGAYGMSDPITLAKGEHRTGVDIDVKYNGKISGIVVEPDGKPLAGVTVVYEAAHVTDAGEDTTAPDGTFRVNSLLGGDDYRASVRTNARNITRLRLADGDGQSIHVKDGATEVTGIRLVVQRDHLSIVGSTVDDSGQPLADVRVDAYRSDGDGFAMFNNWVDHPNAISTADGSFAIADLDSGSFVVHARAGDGSEGVVRGVAAGQKNVVVTLQRAGGIDGTLVGFSAQPAVQAIRQITGVFQTPVFASVDGATFQLRGLNPGTYQIAAVGADTDAQMVEVTAGQMLPVTLKSRGTSTLRGRVVLWPSGTPLAGMRCVAGLRTTPAMPMWIDTIFAISDDSGAFELDDAPAGAVAVTCFGSGPSYSNGRAELTVASGQDARCEVPLVKIPQEVPFASMGAQIQPGPMPARLMSVTPHGPADRAGLRVGDVIASVDGASVLMLTPMAVGIITLIRPVGSTVHLGLTRGDQALAADLALIAQ